MVPVLAAAALNPGSWIAWIVVGLIAGWVASMIMGAGGYGIVGDVIVGLVGAIIGGWVCSLVVGDASYGFWGSVVVSIIGALILIAILRAIVPGSRRAL